MNVEEYWGRGWSLRPEHNKSTMECLGTIIKSGIRFTYYKDEKGGIWFDDEPIGGKPEWMQRADKERRRRHRRHGIEQEVLRLRYITGLKWEEVRWKMGTV